VVGDLVDSGFWIRSIINCNLQSIQQLLKQLDLFRLKMMMILIVTLVICLACVNAFRASVSKSSRISNFVTRSTAVDDKVEVEQYFNGEGFSRWNKIYSDSDEVNKVQLDIRTGHQQTIDKVVAWMSDEENSKKSVCDAGCGVGSLALPMAKMYKKVFASDISASMTNEAAARAASAGLKNLEFKVADMETLNGKYDTVTCIDVMIHYPTDKVR
jgi:magnesium-protoporphyrin O-methyltransferase